MPSTNGRNNKKFEIRGLDRRTNKLYRQEGTAYDCDNVYLNSKKTLVKIPDMDENIVPRGILAETGEFLDKLPFPAVITNLIPYKDYIFMVTEIPITSGTSTTVYNKFYKYFKDTNIVEFIPFGSTIEQYTIYGDVRPAIIDNIKGNANHTILNDNLYFLGDYAGVTGSFTWPTGNEDYEEGNLVLPIEFDGTIVKTAGTPKLIDGGDQGDDGTLTTTEYLRLTPFHLDPQGNQTFGDYETVESVKIDAFFQKAEITTAYLSSSKNNYHAYARLGGSFSLASTDSAAARTLTTAVLDKSVAKGQYLYVVNTLMSKVDIPAGAPFEATFMSYTLYRVKVEEVVYTSGAVAEVTITDFEKYSNTEGKFEDSSTIVYTYEDGTAYMSNMLVAVHGSFNFTHGFTFRRLATVGYTAHNIDIDYYSDIDPAGVTNAHFDGDLLTITDLFEDMYDEEIVKILPPPANSITSYVGTMVLSDTKSVYSSDISLGGNVSNFAPFDNFTAGTEKKGAITGVFASESFLVVFRENESYYITGNIFSGAYQSQSYRSTLIGCVSAASIAEYRGAGIFMSDRGVYLAAQGGQSTELSDIIEPIFTENDLNLGLDLTSTVTLTDPKREYFYFLMDSSVYGKVVLAFSYYHQEWFIFRAPPAEGGVVSIGGTLVSSDGTNVFIEGIGSKEAAAYYTSNFEALGEPAWDKRFLRALVYTPSISEDSEVTIKTYKDWDYTTAITDETESITYPEVFFTQRFDDDRSKSLAIKLESLAGDMFITEGYEYEFIADIGNYRDYA